MKIHELELAGAKDRKRVGRGIGTGSGKTAGRGTKGQNSRTGGGVRPGFEGGQNPLAKRIPKKRGFVPVNRTRYTTFNISDLEQFPAGSALDTAMLVKAGVIKNNKLPVKVLANGQLTKKVTLKVSASSRAARSQIESLGGTIEIVQS